MVYTNVYLIAGYLIDRTTADECGFVDEDGFVETEFKGVVHPYRCCSLLSGDKYIVGRIVHIFHRVKTGPCGRKLKRYDEEELKLNPGMLEFRVCGRYYNCESCLGMTNGGTKRHFDVSSILDNVTTYDPSKVCSSCFDIGYTIDTPCQTCGYTSKDKARPAAHDMKDLVEGDEPSFYLMLDDCLSCT